MIEKHQEEYTPAMPRTEKFKLISTIVDTLKASGTRFLKHDDATNNFYEVDNQTCIDKVWH